MLYRAGRVLKNTEGRSSNWWQVGFLGAGAWPGAVLPRAAGAVLDALLVPIPGDHCGLTILNRLVVVQVRRLAAGTV